MEICDCYVVFIHLYLTFLNLQILPMWCALTVVRIFLQCVRVYVCVCVCVCASAHPPVPMIDNGVSFLLGDLLCLIVTCPS